MRQHPVTHAFRLITALLCALLLAGLSACAASGPALPPNSTSIPASVGRAEKAGDAPAVSHAIPSLEERYFISRLPDDEQAVCTQLYGGIANFEENISFDTPVSEKTLENLMWLLSYDCPELFQINGEYSYFVQEDAPGMALSVHPTYILTKDEYEKASVKVGAVLDQLKSAVSGMSQYDAEKRIYDWIIDHCSYAEDGAFDGTAYGALVLGRARCEGYSKAFSLALRGAGITDLILTGEAWSSDESGPKAAQKHAWNVVKIGDAWYQTDITWDDSDGRLPQGVCYAYFNLTDGDIYKSRTLDGYYSTLAPPVCTSSESNYYARTGQFVQDGENVKEALYAALNGALGADVNAVSLRLSTDGQSRELTDKLEKWMTSWYRGHKFSSGSYNWTQFSVSDVFCIMDITYKK